MDSEILAFLVIAAILLLTVWGIYYFITHPRTKHIAGGMSTTVFGATDGFMTPDKKAAVEIITEVKAKKKMEEQSSKEPKDKQDKTNNSGG